MLDRNKYKFSKKENFKDVYNIARIQFKKIINNFNELDFRRNFEEIFYNTDDYYKLYLKKNNLILCGNLSYIFEDCILTDIYFWNDISFPRNNEEVRFFHEKFFKETSLLGINNTIMPLDKSRFRHKSFKKYCEKLFFATGEYKINDPLIKEEYENHYLLKVNHKNYFKKAEEANVRILYE
jgi:hypothetical protein